jgi:hypothetical protein
MLLAVIQLSFSGVAHYCDAAGSNTFVMFGRSLLRCCWQQHNYYFLALLITAMLLAVTQLSCSGVAYYCDAAGSNTVVMFGRCLLL